MTLISSVCLLEPHSGGQTATTAARGRADSHAAAQAASELGEPFSCWISIYICGYMAIAHGQLQLAEGYVAAALRTARDGGLPEADAAMPNIST
jgi:hypothetical protein